MLLFKYMSKFLLRTKEFQRKCGNICITELNAVLIYFQQQLNWGGVEVKYN